MDEILKTQISQILDDAKIIIDNQNKILATVPNNEVLKNELASKVNNDDFKPIFDAMNLHLNNSNFSENGYTKLPNGLILQWGTFINSTTVILPIAFPNAFFGVCGSYAMLAGSSIGDAEYEIVNNASFKTRANGAGKQFFIAIGY